MATEDKIINLKDLKAVYDTQYKNRCTISGVLVGSEQRGNSRYF